MARPRGGGDWCAPSLPRERGATWARSVPFPKRSGSRAVMRSKSALSLFEAQTDSVPKFLKKVAGQAVDSSARRLVEWSAVGRSVDTRASFPSFAWGVRPSPRAHAHTRPRTKRTTFAPQGNHANLRTHGKREDICERKNIYYVYKHTYLSFSLGFLRSHYVRKSVANCERKVTFDGSRHLPKAKIRRICERLRT